MHCYSVISLLHSHCLPSSLFKSELPSNFALCIKIKIKNIIATAVLLKNSYIQNVLNKFGSTHQMTPLLSVMGLPSCCCILINIQSLFINKFVNQTGHPTELMKCPCLSKMDSSNIPHCHSLSRCPLWLIDGTRKCSLFSLFICFCLPLWKPEWQ